MFYPQTFETDCATVTLFLLLWKAEAAYFYLHFNRLLFLFYYFWLDTNKLMD